jgi:hypothetical protein
MAKILMLATSLVLLAGCVVVPLGYPYGGYGYHGGYGYGGYGNGGYGNGGYGNGRYYR